VTGGTTAVRRQLIRVDFENGRMPKYRLFVGGSGSPICLELRASFDTLQETLGCLSEIVRSPRLAAEKLRVAQRVGEVEFETEE
jgi:hypothetical protein